MSSETTQPSHVTAMDGEAYATLQKSARDHLWMHFTRMSSYDQADVLVAFRVVDIDSDGSAVILWKLLKTYPAPRLAQK